MQNFLNSPILKKEKKIQSRFRGIVAFVCYVNLVDGVAYSDHFSQTGISYELPTENEVSATRYFLYLEVSY